MAGTVLKNKRLIIVDVMQGLAMILVLIGHHLLSFMPDEYRHCHTYIYTFHMPFFIFISSFLIAYSYKAGNYRDYIARKFRKFFLPYIVIGLIITIIAGITSGWNTVLENIITLIISPKQSEATFLWYIYLLFIFYMIYPAVYHFKVKTGNLLCGIILCAIGIILFIFPVPSGILCMDYLTKYFIFFVLGITAAWNFDKLKTNTAILYYSSIAFLLIFIFMSIYYFKGYYSMRYFLPFASIPALYSLCLFLRKVGILRKVLVYISKNCFDIYLVHMFFIQGLAFLTARLLHIETLSIPLSIVYIIISTTISILGSILIFKTLKLLNATKNGNHLLY